MSSEASTHLIPIWNAAAFQESHLALLLGSAAQVQQPHTDLPLACLTDLTGIAPPQKSPGPALTPQTSFLGTTSPSPQAFSPKTASAQYLDRTESSRPGENFWLTRFRKAGLSWPLFWLVLWVLANCWPCPCLGFFAVKMTDWPRAVVGKLFL